MWHESAIFENSLPPFCHHIQDGARCCLQFELPVIIWRFYEFSDTYWHILWTIININRQGMKWTQKEEIICSGWWHFWRFLVNIETYIDT